MKTMHNNTLNIGDEVTMELKKVVINTCYGGYGLSEMARDLYKHLKD